MGREFFCAYHSLLQSIEPLSDAERGRLFTACLEYSKTGVMPELRGNERFIFPTIKGQIDRDMASYEKKLQAQTENGKLGGRPKKPNNPTKTKKPMGYSENPTKPKKAMGYSENPTKPIGFKNDLKKDKDNNNNDHDNNNNNNTNTNNDHDNNNTNTNNDHDNNNNTNTNNDHDHQKNLQIENNKTITTSSLATQTVQTVKNSLNEHSESLKTIQSHYEQMFGHLMSTTAVTEIIDFLKHKAEAAMICRAIDAAVDANVRKWVYVKKIINENICQGILTLQQFNLNEANRETSKNKRDTKGGGNHVSNIGNTKSTEPDPYEGIESSDF